MSGKKTHLRQRGSVRKCPQRPQRARSHRARWKWRAALLSLLLSTPAYSQDSTAGSFASELPRIAPTEPGETLKNFRVANGFEIQLVASEPLVASPVAIEWDADGAMYVCEMRGYSEHRDESLSRIRRLTDSDGDGVYDQATVFADGLLWPTAIFPFDGGLFVGDAPDIVYFKDTTGDGIADERRVVLTGFEASNVQGLLNSFRWGLDNRIHVACSSAGGAIHRPGQAETAVDVRGRDLSFDPKTFDLQATSGGGQHGMCFDDWGRKFCSSNSDHIQQILYEDRYIARNPRFSGTSARVSIAADGPQAEVFRTSPVEPWRIVRTRLRVGGLVPGPIEGGGRAAGYFTGATGVTIYRGDAWPDSYKGLALVGDVGSNLIHRKQLESDGLPFVARRVDEGTEFVSSSDIWFRPAQFANAPDGTLHVIDVCREVIEHPKSLPEEIKQHLDLDSGRDRGRIYRIVASGHRPVRETNSRLASMTSDELVRLLDHPNAWHRETASRLLFERQDTTVIESLRSQAGSAGLPQGRLQAMYALNGLSALDEATVLSRLNDSHPAVRRHAVRLCETLDASDLLMAKLAALVDDPDPEVRFQLAFTLGSIEHAERLALLTRLIRRDVDSAWIRLAVQSSLSQGAIELFQELVADEAFRSEGAATFLGSVASQISREAKPAEMQAALESISVLTEQETIFAIPVAMQLLNEMSRQVQSESTDDATARTLASRIRESLVRAAMQQANADDGDAKDRARAIRALSLGTWDDVGASLLSFIDTRQPIEIQTASIETMGGFADEDMATPLIDRWNELSPSARSRASEVLFARPNWTVKLFDAVDSGGLTIGDIARDRLTMAANSPNDAVKSRATVYLRSSLGPSRASVVSVYREALTRDGDVARDGDVDRGREVFSRSCASCHRLEKRGHEIGPNLATIKARGAETILVNVLDPNAEVNPQYLNYVLLADDGRSVTGMIAAENANSLTLRRAEAAEDTILRSEIERLQSTGKSIMPEGMESAIDIQSMADLLSYLMQVNE